MIPLRDDNPTELVPFVTVGFIIINVLVFFYQLSLGPQARQFVIQLGTIPWEITHFRTHPESAALPPFVSLFTSMFLHGGWAHLIGNMLFLWIFGNNIEDALGHFKFVIFYVLTGLLASAGHIVANPNSLVPTIGASGAISGIMGAYILLYPRARVLTLVFLVWIIQVVEIPAIIFLGIWFVLQLSSGFTTAGTGGGVAWFAHIGGFVAGLILVKLFERKAHRQQSQRRRPQPRFREFDDDDFRY